MKQFLNFCSTSTHTIISDGCHITINSDDAFSPPDCYVNIYYEEDKKWDFYLRINDDNFGVGITLLYCDPLNINVSNPLTIESYIGCNGDIGYRYYHFIGDENVIENTNSETRLYIKMGEQKRKETSYYVTATNNNLIIKNTTPGCEREIRIIAGNIVMFLSLIIKNRDMFVSPISI